MFTIYKIRFEWDDTHRSISWMVSPSAMGLNFVGENYNHFYSIMTSGTEFQDMQQNDLDVSLWEISARVRHGRNLQFQVARDRDLRQIIYPSDSDSRAGCGVLGPDDDHRGRMFQVQSDIPLEMVKIILRVRDGAITVVATMDAGRETTWQSASPIPQCICHVVGSWSAWKPVVMDAHSEIPGIYKCLFIISSAAFEEFQIRCNNDPSQVLHPGKMGALPGPCLSLGPDDNGHDLNWRVVGSPGSEWEITLDFQAEDRRQVVTCIPTEPQIGDFSVPLHLY